MCTSFQIVGLNFLLSSKAFNDSFVCDVSFVVVFFLFQAPVPDGCPLLFSRHEKHLKNVFKAIKLVRA